MERADKDQLTLGQLGGGTPWLLLQLVCPRANTECLLRIAQPCRSISATRLTHQFGHAVKDIPIGDSPLARPPAYTHAHNQTHTTHRLDPGGCPMPPTTGVIVLVSSRPGDGLWVNFNGDGSHLRCCQYADILSLFCS